MTSPACLCVLNSQGEVLFTSQGWSRFQVRNPSPYAPLIKTGFNLLSLEDLPPTDTVALMQIGARAVLEHERDSFSFEYSLTGIGGAKIVLRIDVTPLDGPNSGCQILVENITHRKQTDVDATFFSRLEKLISEASLRLSQSSISQIDENIETSLKEISQFVGVDYSFLTRFSEDRQSTSMTHFWHSDPPADFGKHFQSLPVGENPYREKLLANEVFLVSKFDELPDQYRNYREQALKLGGKSIAGVPILVEGVCEGYMGLVTCTRYREWTDREMMILRVLSEIFGAALLRQRVERALLEREKNLLLSPRESQDPSWCFAFETPILIDLPIEEQLKLFQNGVIHDCNEAGARFLGLDSVEKTIGAPGTEAFSPFHEHMDPLIRTFIQNGYRSINYRIKANHADGSSQILMTQSQGVLDDGRLVRIWVSWRDITHLGDEAGAVSGAGQYRNSSLTPSEIQEYIDLIERIMKTDRPYLDSTFNLAKLSKLVRVPDYQLSQVLNVGMKTSFYDLVNQYRVESLTELMTSPALDPISILDLAYRVGFNSKSTFNTAFKKITGKTPSVYRAEKQAERASGIRQKVPSF